MQELTYRLKERCEECNGIVVVLPLDINGIDKTLANCKSCGKSTIMDIPYNQFVSNNKLPIYLTARTVKMYGINGTDNSEYMNVRTHRDKIFVFGDNLIHKGKGGQAIIRDEENSFGIPTKRLPSMDENSFFSDTEEERNAVLTSLRELYKLSTTGKEIVFPKDGLGTGLAEMHIRSPKLFKEMNDIIFEHWNIKFKEPEINIVQNSLFE